MINQRLVDLQYQAQQRCLAMEADVEPYTKTRKRTEGAAEDRAKHGDGTSARVDDGSTSLTSFGMVAEPVWWLPQNAFGDALINKDAEAPKPNFRPVEVRMPSSTAGGFMPAGTASPTMRAIFPPPPLSWSLLIGENTKNRTGRTDVDQLAHTCWRKVLETKSRQTLVFDPGGCTDRLRACPFLGGRRALLRGRFVWDAAMVSEAEAFLLVG